MSVVVAMSFVVSIDKEGDHEVIQSSVMGPTQPINDWAYEECGDTIANIVNDIADNHKHANYIHVLGLVELSSGKDADTPNGPGEYWTDASPASDFHVYELSEQDVKDMGIIDGYFTMSFE